MAENNNHFKGLYLHGKLISVEPRGSNSFKNDNGETVSYKSALTLQFEEEVTLTKNIKGDIFTSIVKRYPEIKLETSDADLQTEFLKYEKMKGQIIDLKLDIKKGANFKLADS